MRTKYQNTKQKKSTSRTAYAGALVPTTALLRAVHPSAERIQGDILHPILIHVGTERKAQPFQAGIIRHELK